MPDHLTTSTVASGPLAGWPTVTIPNGEVAIGRHCWGRVSGNFTADEAWAAWDAYWAAQR
jgi:hypothetical protein